MTSSAQLAKQLTDNTASVQWIEALLAAPFAPESICTGGILLLRQLDQAICADDEMYALVVSHGDTRSARQFILGSLSNKYVTNFHGAEPSQQKTMAAFDARMRLALQSTDKWPLELLCEALEFIFEVPVLAAFCGTVTERAMRLICHLPDASSMRKVMRMEDAHQFANETIHRINQSSAARTIFVTELNRKLFLEQEMIREVDDDKDIGDDEQVRALVKAALDTPLMDALETYGGKHAGYFSTEMLNVIDPRDERCIVDMSALNTAFAKVVDDSRADAMEQNTQNK